MSEPLLAVLRLCLLALLYLFFLRVLRAVWTEIRGPRVAPAAVVAAPVPERKRRSRSGNDVPQIPRLRVVEPPELSGRTFDLGEELTIGRAAGCQITLDDTFVSQIHTRVYQRDGQFLVEDLGSTNGTYLNRQKVSGPMVLRVGDRVQVGNTVLEFT
ncbi:MAG TPA: FHA domain-containing protein [Acidimicrobiales bacterium]|nr:FHA domain-containing protein [Acidimicrobiales bacterium]